MFWMMSSPFFWCQVITWGGASPGSQRPFDLGARRLHGVVGSNAAFAGILEDDTVPHGIFGRKGTLPMGALRRSPLFYTFRVLPLNPRCYFSSFRVCPGQIPSHHGMVTTGWFERQGNRHLIEIEEPNRLFSLKKMLLSQNPHYSSFFLVHQYLILSALSLAASHILCSVCLHPSLNSNVTTPYFSYWIVSNQNCTNLWICGFKKLPIPINSPKVPSAWHEILSLSLSHIMI